MSEAPDNRVDGPPKGWRRVPYLYRTQIDLMWRWRAGRVALLRRALVAVFASLVALIITAALSPTLKVTDLWAALAAVIVISALNLLVRPVLLALVMDRSIVLLVIATLVFQTIVIMALPAFIPGVQFTGGFLNALIISFAFGFLVSAISTLLGLGEEGSYYGALVRTLQTRRADVIRTDQPGLVIIQVDGLSHDVLSHSVRAGRVPTMSSWMRDGTHRLGHWDALLPSTTPASQAGILHGNNDGIPNFRWWEKENGRLLVANHPLDATDIEKRISNGQGLLSPGGASISNIFTGDGERAFLVMSTIKVAERGVGASDAFAWFFVSPYNYLTMGIKYFAEVVKENIQSRRQARAGIVPRMHRGFPYPWVRAATNVALRSLGTSLVVQEMFRGTPVIYMDYTDYDEIAHHSGPERPESLDALDGVDRELAALKKASAEAPRPYRFVILADHGQSLGSTFLQRYGMTLQDVVRSLMGGNASVAAATSQIEDWGQLNQFVREVSEAKGVTGSLARVITRKSTPDEQALGPGDAQFTPASSTGTPAQRAPDGDKSATDAQEKNADLIVVAGGNLALIYLNAEPGRLTLERVNELHPGMIEALANHPGVGFVMVRSETKGAVTFGKHGLHQLADDHIEGEDPLAIYGPLAAQAVRRLDEIEHVGDIAVVSQYDPETGEIAAFEELIGAHGGLGGAQTQPFLLYPADWQLEAPPLGAPAVYRQLRAWMESELGFEFPAARPAAAPPDAATKAERVATAS